ncbi:hypothetical protein KPL78_06060 [Roseomonas sp. HJA6]|uniref:HTH luxR-type domain-containing protein n=1 Tax=Roseomonas alba TaxID=2846776 RepID=A0ABS7A517_9PROT|nr:hypothetical protein [Neoroseomonas alba]MBW6397406.1 hypothetical protein [Neoroseomonas alba]
MEIGSWSERTERDRAALGILEGLYDAVTTPAGWYESCRALAGHVGAETALLCLDRGNAVIPVALPGFSATAQRGYAEHYHRVDPWTLAARRLQQSEGRLYSFLGQDHVPASVFEESEVWQDFSRHHLGAFHLLGSGFRMDDGSQAILGLHRPRDARAFDHAERRQLHRLLPHLRNALFLAHRLDAAEGLAASGFAVLEQIASGIAIIDRQRNVVFANAAMERHASAAEILLRTEAGNAPPGRGALLSLARPADQTRFVELVECASRLGAGGALRLHSADSGRHLLLLVMPLPQRLSPWRDSGRILAPGRVLVILRDQAHPAALDGEMLKSLYGFTDAEEAVARALLGGRSPEAVAKDRGVSVPTIRTQIRHILEKAGARSLRELEGLLVAP